MMVSPVANVPVVFTRKIPTPGTGVVGVVSVPPTPKVEVVVKLPDPCANPVMPVPPVAVFAIFNTPLPELSPIVAVPEDSEPATISSLPLVPAPDPTLIADGTFATTVLTVAFRHC
jgi:hypothetical protein